MLTNNGPVGQDVGTGHIMDADGLSQGGKPVLMLTPLAVGFQAVHEAEKFGHDAGLSRTGKPVAAICHAPWTLIEADVVRDRHVTSWPSLQTDLRNAGATWQDREVVVDDNGGLRNRGIQLDTVTSCRTGTRVADGLRGDVQVGQIDVHDGNADRSGFAVQPGPPDG